MKRSYSENAKKVRLLINAEKQTVQMIFNTEKSDPLVHDGHQISMVEDFKYLGSYIRSSEKDIEMRIGLTWAAFEKLRHILTSSKIDLKLRMRIFNAACIPVLLYGCESWTITETSSDTLNCLVRTFYRIICGVKQSETHMTNEEL
ncbi:unnamed protein product [Brachionus calyciflorus]|uniref:Endonuclease-reverse transcriptase n=1 Tax=Brachionus calyciflorus TaxID=104777 RepID=A0A813SYL8_9BILA|nr:unnamed protein product [Brachionus calyciflorus]